MTAFEYTITDSIGIHARPAGMLAKRPRSSRARFSCISAIKKRMHAA